MSILERKIIHDGATLCSHIRYPEFILPRHRHAEYELMLFSSGSGKQFVGEGVAEYTEGDIALIGSYVPHLHLCNTKLDSNMDCQPSSGDALQFHPDIFPEHMERIPDYRDICSLLHKSQYGLRFYDRILYSWLKMMLIEMDHYQYTQRLTGLYLVLEKLNTCKDVRILSETAYNCNNQNLLPDANEPVNKVYSYLYTHFREKITLTDLAEYVKLNPAALCRYFKRRTDKTIFRCLAEIRMEHACKLLSYSNLSVSQIAYESGYNNVSYFVMQFGKIMKRNPGEYRRQLDL